MERCKRLDGKVVVITGAAQGLGRALAQRMVDEGAKVAIGDINLEQANETAQIIGNGAFARKVDVTKFEDLEELAKAAYETFGKIDVLIANAAIVIAKPIVEFESNLWNKVCEVNLTGYFNSCKAVVPYMRENKKGSIVQINSKSGKKGSAKNSAYAASKFGGIGLTQSLALELAEEQIRVNSVCPGNLLNSPLWQNSLFEQYAKNQGITKEEVRQKYIDQVPMKRPCEYEDVANLVVFLASDQSSYMTGQAINVTGGQEMK